ncbi:hypothetical protein M404DRAFT_996607 [Pisolithus tinctorius Marx 270]|uniref:Uncharacterized protein n=1 Tax=Pisolithus tinctorius Marx 270 TaxID=870435 RepID=A0A0C3KJJ9_PISTI|nr:hypothetical protein M404DRAFT_996607 [Pisolithus tinctorius Marx 270]
MIGDQGKGFFPQIHYIPPAKSVLLSTPSSGPQRYGSRLRPNYRRICSPALLSRSAGVVCGTGLKKNSRWKAAAVFIPHSGVCIAVWSLFSFTEPANIICRVLQAALCLLDRGRRLLCVLRLILTRYFARSVQRFFMAPTRDSLPMSLAHAHGEGKPIIKRKVYGLYHLGVWIFGSVATLSFQYCCILDTLALLLVYFL